MKKVIGLFLQIAVRRLLVNLRGAFYGWGKFYPKRVIQIGGVEFSTQISHVKDVFLCVFCLFVWLSLFGDGY